MGAYLKNVAPGRISRSYQLLRTLLTRVSAVSYPLVFPMRLSAPGVLGRLIPLPDYSLSEGPLIGGRTATSAPGVLGRLNLVQAFVCAGRLNPRMLAGSYYARKRSPWSWHITCLRSFRLVFFSIIMLLVSHIYQKESTTIV